MASVHIGGTCLDGDRWGPASTCRVFDLTAAFENIILTILPSSVLLVLVVCYRLPRIVHKHRLADRLVPHDPLGIAQAISAAALLVLAIAVLACACIELNAVQLIAAGGNGLLLGAQALEFLAAVGLLFAVLAERKHTAGGSFVLPLYLLATILFDGARLRTYCQLPAEVGIRSTAYFAVFAAMLGVRTLLFFLLSTNLARVEQEASFVNRLGFFWLMPLIFGGMRRTLTIDSLPALGPRYETRHLGEMFKAAYPYSAMAQGKIPKRGLFGGVLRAFYYNLTTPIIPKIVATAVTLAQPYLIQDTIIYIGSYAGIPGYPPQPASKGWSLAGAYALVYTVQALASSQYLFATKQNQVVISGALLEALYDKAVRIELSTATELGSAKAVNLMSQDVQRIMRLIDPVHEIWSAIATVAVAIYICWDALHTVFVVVLFMAFLILFLGPACAIPMGPAQAAWSGATDRRVRLTTSVFASIKAIKMSALEPFFVRKILALRKTELANFRKFSTHLTAVVCSTHILGNSIPVFTFVALAAVCHKYPDSTNYSFSSAKVFTALNAINIMVQPLAEIGQQIGNLVAALASIKRLEEFLLSEEKVDEEPARVPDKKPDVASGSAAASMVWGQPGAEAIPLVEIDHKLEREHKRYPSTVRDHKRYPSTIRDHKRYPSTTMEPESPMSAFFTLSGPETAPDPRLIKADIGWKDEPTLAQVSLTLTPGLTMVVGRLSSGKSTLLHAFLGETRILGGRAENLPRPITGNDLVGYAPQDYWTQETMTIRANIVFYNPAGYDPAWYSQVVEACALKPDLAKFELGDQRLAKSLSGGQKQRINLARAVYARQASMFILDDPLSAVDAKTEAHIWTHLFGPEGLLRGRRVLLASNAVFRIKDADRIVHILPGGRALMRTPHDASAALASDLATKDPTETIDALDDEDSSSFDAMEADKRRSRQMLEDMRAVAPGGEVQGPVQMTRLDALEDIEAEQATIVEEDEDQNKMDTVFEKRVGLSSYWFWVTAARPWRVALMVFLLVFCSMSNLAYQIFIQHWTDNRHALEPGTYGPMMGGYLALWGALFFLSVICIRFTFVEITIPAGWTIHQRILTAVMAAPMSFFTARSSGQVVARHSGDLFMVDMEWIMALFGFILLAFSLLGSCILMIVEAPYTAITFVAAMTIALLIRWMYLPNSRQMRRLEMASRSPLYTLFGDCTSGLAVIRAFGAVEPLRAMNTKYATNLQKATYSLFSAQQWLQTWLEIAAMLMNVTLVLVVIGRRHAHNVNVLGVALTQTVSLSGLVTWAVTSLMEVEIVAIVFERLQEFAQTASEFTVAAASALSAGVRPAGDGSASSSPSTITKDFGPRRGVEIAFSHVGLAYDEGGQVLHDVTFTVAAGGLLGICGRSGSGKSTLLAGLLRMQDISTGAITLDGVDVRSLSLENLRHMMTVVVQEPFLVDGLTVRDNLLLGGSELNPDQDNDETEARGDEDMWTLLRETGLESKVEALDKKLATPMEEAGFSRGQSQILAVTRALLSDKPIVILDEVTSSLDRESDLQIQKLLHAHADQGKTVFTIAHRIEDIIDYDTVLVLDEGRVMELGPPSKLLARPDGMFRTLATLQGISVDGILPPSP